MVGKKGECDKLDNILPAFEIRTTQFSDDDVIQRRCEYMSTLENVFAIVSVSVDVVEDTVEPQ